MSKKFEKLNEVFNVSSEAISTELDTIDKDIQSLAKKQETEDKDKKSDVEKDYEYARGNLYSLMEKSQEALNGILELAQESDMPRAYEVAGQLIKSTGDIADKILLVHKILKDVEDIEGDKKISAQTVPMILGVHRTKILVAGLLIFTPLLYFFFLLDDQFSAFGLTLVTSAGWLLASIVDLFGFVSLAFLANSAVRRNHLLIKLSMLFGILTTLHVAISYYFF